MAGTIKSFEIKITFFFAKEHTMASEDEQIPGHVSEDVS